MLKNAILAFFNAPGAAPVRTRLRRIKHLQCLIRGETSLSHTSRLFFNSLLVIGELLERTDGARDQDPGKGDGVSRQF